MTTKKRNDIICALEAQKKMGLERLSDSGYSKIWDQIQRDLNKIDLQLKKLKV